MSEGLSGRQGRTVSEWLCHGGFEERIFSKQEAARTELYQIVRICPDSDKHGTKAIISLLDYRTLDESSRVSVPLGKLLGDREYLLID